MYERIVQFIKEGRSFALATVVKVSGSAPCGEAAKLLVLADGFTEGTVGGGKLEARVKEDALKAIRAGKSCLKEYKLTGNGGIGMVCGGETHVFIEVVNPPPKLLICGAGHIGVALYNIATILGWRVIVVDDRKEGDHKGSPLQKRFPKAEVHCCNISASFVKGAVDKNTLAVIAMRDHSLDERVLKSLLRTDAKYIGMIGSKAKTDSIKNKLRAEGFSEDRLNRVFTPIGLDIGAETPEEIAISIIAELIHFLRKGGPSTLSLKLKNKPQRHGDAEKKT